MLIILSHHCVVQLTLLSSGNIKIGTVAASGKLSWSLLDGLVERLFSEYLMLVDPVTNLGLAAESVKSYNIGEIVRLSFPGTIIGVASMVVRHGMASSRPPSQTQNLLESRAR